MKTIPGQERHETIQLIGENVKLYIGEEEELEDLSQKSVVDLQSLNDRGSDSRQQMGKSDSGSRLNTEREPPLIYESDDDSVDERSDLSWADDAVSLTASEAQVEVDQMESNGPTIPNVTRDEFQSTMIQMPHESKIKSENTM